MWTNTTMCKQNKCNTPKKDKYWQYLRAAQQMLKEIPKGARGKSIGNTAQQSEFASVTVPQENPESKTKEVNNCVTF